ncbi:glycosyltransferase family 1 protein [soil metagenome]
MKILVDGGNSGSGGYLRYLAGVFGTGALDSVEVLLVCSPRIAAALGELDRQVTVLVEAQLDALQRRTRLAWWRQRWPVLVREFGPDVVLHPAGLLRGRSGDVPRVAIHHSMAPFTKAMYRLYGPSRMSAEMLYWRMRLLRSFRRADGVVFHADYTRRAVSCQSGGITRSTLVPNAVPSAFSAAPLRDASLSAPVKLLCVSSLHLFKHQWQVVAAVAMLRRELGIDLRLNFVGSGEQRARTRLLRSIEGHAATSWTSIEEIPAESMPGAYKDADVFVFASSIEAWPITLGEAMASGLPIACSDRMAMPDILRDAGTYFDPEDPVSIADALRPLLTDPGLRSRCGALAREYAQEFTWERSAAGVVNFLRQVAKERELRGVSR